MTAMVVATAAGDGLRTRRSQEPVAEDAVPIAGLSGCRPGHQEHKRVRDRVNDAPRAFHAISVFPRLGIVPEAHTGLGGVPYTCRAVGGLSVFSLQSLRGNSWPLDWRAYRTRYRDIPKPATWRQRAWASINRLRPGSARCLQGVPGRCRARANPLDDGGRHFRTADRREFGGRDEVGRSAAGPERRFDPPLDRHGFLLRLQRVA